MSRTRLDQALVERGIVPTLDRARAEILAGNVLIDERPGVSDRAMARGPAKPSDEVGTDQVLRLRTPPARFVSRGGLKLAAALDRFKVDAARRVCVDLGASTGGFTDCLLQRGAERVYAVDVGQNQLAWRLRCDPRVVSMEKTDARELVLPVPVSLVVGDVSFISLSLLLPTVDRLLRSGAPAAPMRAEAILLIKPQFEVGSSRVEPGGRVRDPVARQAGVDRVLAGAAQCGLIVLDVIDCPIPGARAGNVEALVHLVSEAARSG